MLSKIKKSTVLGYTPMMQVKFVWHWDRRKEARLYQIVKIHNAKGDSKKKILKCVNKVKASVKNQKC